MRHYSWLTMGSLASVAALVWACSSEESESNTPTGTAISTGGQSAGGQHAGGQGGGAQGGQAAQGGSGGLPVEQESEPNDGATETDYDDLSVDVVMAGAIGTPGDADVFRLPTDPGTAYQAVLEPRAGSPLEPHVAVYDDGRGSDPPADDYVKIVRGPSGAVRIQWLAMGQGGYFVTVRDARNVDGQSLGDDTFGYRLTVSEIELATVTVGALPVSSPHTGALSFAGGIDLFGFSATAFQDAVIDLQAQDDLDGRLYVFAESTGDWIARNDDRSVSDPDPLIDAPLTEGGNLLLVVENIAETPTGLSYSLTASVQ